MGMGSSMMNEAPDVGGPTASTKTAPPAAPQTNGQTMTINMQEVDEVKQNIGELKSKLQIFYIIKSIM